MLKGSSIIGILDRDRWRHGVILLCHIQKKVTGKDCSCSFLCAPGNTIRQRVLARDVLHFLSNEILSKREIKN